MRVAYAIIDGSVSNDIYEQRRAAFDRWLEKVQGDSYSDGYGAGVHDGRRAEVNGL